jgi:hypothetical protein
MHNWTCVVGNADAKCSKGNCKTCRKKVKVVKNKGGEEYPKGYSKSI